LIETRERVIAIEHTVTPVLQVRNSLLILPIVGVIDSLRAKQLTDTLLRAIRENRAKVVIIDITGVAAVDSRVANHIILTVAASRLMGARVIVTGLSADVAQSIVTLGIDLSALHTVGDLEGGLEEAERLLGYTMTRPNSSSSNAD
jgi:rsbT co-antagonist protein RsbR